MTPTRDELAREVAERNNECGHTANGLVCTQPKNHDGGHRGMPVEKAIPIS